MGKVCCIFHIVSMHKTAHVMKCFQDQGQRNVGGTEEVFPCSSLISYDFISFLGFVKHVVINTPFFTKSKTTKFHQVILLHYIHNTRYRFLFWISGALPCANTLLPNLTSHEIYISLMLQKNMCRQTNVNYKPSHPTS